MGKVFHIPIEKLTVVTGRGPDHIGIETTLKNPLRHEPGEENIHLDIRVPIGKGKQFCKLLFPGLPVEVISTENGQQSFSES